MRKIKVISLVALLISGAIICSDFDSDSDYEMELDGQMEQLRLNGIPIERNHFPLHEALIAQKPIDVIKDLINQQEDSNEQYGIHDEDDNYLVTPATLAAKTGNLEALKLLYLAGANLNFNEDADDENTFTPLKVAIQNDQFDVITWLLNIKNKQGGHVVDRDLRTLDSAIVRSPVEYVLQELHRYFPACLERKGDGSFGIKAECPEAVGHYALLQRLQRENQEIINTINGSKTPFLSAVEDSLDTGLITLLCRTFGADPNISDRDGITPLLVAIQNNDVLMVSTLLECGADSNLMDDAGHTPLIEAIKEGKLLIAGLLLKAGAGVNVRDGSGITPLITSILVKNEQIFDLLLLVNGIDLTMPDAQGHTPLWYAVEQKSYLFFSELLSRKALLDKEAYIFLVTKLIDAPILELCFNPIVRYCPDFDFSMPLDAIGTTALMYVLLSKNDSFLITLLELLQEKNINNGINKQNNFGQTLVMLAAQQGNLECIHRCVVCYGASLDQKDQKGKTVFDYINAFIDLQKYHVDQMLDSPEKEKKLKYVDSLVRDKDELFSLRKGMEKQ